MCHSVALCVHNNEMHVVVAVTVRLCLVSTKCHTGH